MIFDNSLPERRFFAPEVVQTSAMDCGPATLKCILEGFGISVSYGRLREACQTDIDGTSIDVMEDVANQLGLDAEQVMVPGDHLLFPETQTLPAIVIVRLPSGLTHFVVAWRLHKHIVQVMDPVRGRCWQTRTGFLNTLYIHKHPIPAKAWRMWADAEGFREPLQHRMRKMGLASAEIHELIHLASEDAGWYSLASLDAAARMTDTLLNAGGLSPGKETAKVLTSFFTKARERPPESLQFSDSSKNALIPLSCWAVEPLPADADVPDKEALLLLKGAVLVRILGRRKIGESPEKPDKEPVMEIPETLSPELAAALEEKPQRPESEILTFLKADGLLTPVILIFSLMMAVFCVTIEAMLFRGLLEIGDTLWLLHQRISAMAMLFLFAMGMLLLEIPIASTVQRMGRRFENRLRIAFLEKIPRLGDRYFHSRLTSDMIQRIHELRGIRNLPALGVSLIRIAFQIILTALGIIFIIPTGSGIAVLATLFSVGISFVSQPVLAEKDLRLRTHVGGLSRFYLDAMLGLVPIRTHCAERALRREHEGLLVEWVHTSFDFLKAILAIGAMEAIAGVGFTIWILFYYVAHNGDAKGILLLFYWTLNLPVLGKSLASFAQQYPMHRNRVLRILEPLNAPEEEGEKEERSTETSASSLSSDKEKRSDEKDASSGIAIALENVTVHAGGQMILSDINLRIHPGEHIAVVGSSGAGKSSLVGLFLGWHTPASGRIQADGALLSKEHLKWLRRHTVWVDPAVQIWNRSLYENLRYGTYDAETSRLNKAIEAADLFHILERLPDGLQTRLGEGGGLVSGGEGQRVRLGRGILRSEVKLVILDEPFRGLDREKRRSLLKKARQHWQNATLIFISHDVGESMTFNRVLVIEEGRLAEDDTPEHLVARSDSRYHTLFESEAAVRKGLWENAEWRRLWLEQGKLEELPPFPK